MDKRTSPNRQKKEKIVAELAEKVNRAHGMVFTSYQGLTHQQLENIKKKVKALDAEFVATKNTLIKLAFENVSKGGKVSKVSNGTKTPSDTFDTSKPFDTLKNATATLFLYADPVMPLKEIAKSIKELNLPTIKFGFLDGKQMTSEQFLKLSTLPSREVLLTQLVFGLKSPISGLHRSLLWNMQKFVMTLKAIETVKSSK